MPSSFNYRAIKLNITFFVSLVEQSGYIVVIHSELKPFRWCMVMNHNFMCLGKLTLNKIVKIK